MIYKDTTQAVTFRRTGFTIDNIAYDNVFLLKPGETCEISFPDDMKTYRIVECGVNTDVYEQVDVNGTPVEGTSGPGYPANRKDYGIEHSSTDDRARVKYTNEVNPHALRTMTVVKKLFKEDGVTPIPYESDDVNFSFRLYLASEFDTLKEANMHTYHVRNPKGEYCGWDTPGQKFYSLGKTNYDDLSDAEKEAASFTTSIYPTTQLRSGIFWQERSSEYWSDQTISPTDIPSRDTSTTARIPPRRRTWESRIPSQRARTRMWKSATSRAGDCA